MKTVNLLETYQNNLSSWNTTLDVQKAAYKYKKDIPLGLVLFEGNSPIDQKPIVVIATGFKTKTPNRKTGEMIQIYILRSDIPPQDAAQSGDDFSICGDCKHRPTLNNTCYVLKFHGPRIVYDTYKNEGYERLSLRESLSWLKDRAVRFGAYGDPAMIPKNIIAGICRVTESRTGYTHQWQEDFASDLQGFFQASVDNKEEYFQAKQLSWKTFRVKTEDDKFMRAEALCPATIENSGVQCIDCTLCDGKTKDVVVDVHGSGVSKFEKLSA